MQNDFLHPDGSFGRMATEHPEFNIDTPFLVGTIPHVKRLADAFRAAALGSRREYLSVNAAGWPQLPAQR